VLLQDLAQHGLVALQDLRKAAAPGGAVLRDRRLLQPASAGVLVEIGARVDGLVHRGLVDRRRLGLCLRRTALARGRGGGRRRCRRLAGGGWRWRRRSGSSGTGWIRRRRWGLRDGAGIRGGWPG